MSGYNKKIRNIRALDRCPGPGVFLVQLYLLVSHKQLQLVPRICIILQSDFYVMYRISGVT